MAYPNPADVQAMKDAEDVVVMEQEGLNVGYLAYNTQMPPFEQRQRAQSVEYGDRQTGDHRRGVPGLRRDRQEPAAANNVVLQRRRSRMTNTIPKPRKPRWKPKACLT